MVGSRRILSSTLATIKRFVDEWLVGDRSFGRDDLAVLAKALDIWKEEIQQKLSQQAATITVRAQPPPETSSTSRRGNISRTGRSERSSCANQGVRRSKRRIGPSTNHTDSSTLFVPENISESESDREITLTRIQPTNGASVASPRATIAQPVPLGEPSAEYIDNDHAWTGNRSPAEEQPELVLQTQSNVHEQASSHMEITELEDVGLDEHDPLAEFEPHYFNEAFEDMFGIEYGFGIGNEGAEEQHEVVTQDAADYTVPLIHEGVVSGTNSVQRTEILNNGALSETPFPPHHESQNLGEDAEFKGSLELAHRFNFRLPHESEDDTTDAQGSQILLPLVEGRSLSTRLLHGLLYTLLPPSLRIMEVCADDNPLADGQEMDNFVAIVSRPQDSQPLLILGDVTSRTLYILDRETADRSFLMVDRTPFATWTTERIDPNTVGPHVEPTLLSVFIAEACFRHALPIAHVPSSHDLRLRFLRELLAPYERNNVLEQYGIPHHFTVSQTVDTRITSPARTERTTDHTETIPEIRTFDTSALRNAFRKKPTGISPLRSLRILQSVNEIGSRNILDSLKLALITKPEKWAVQGADEPIIEKLCHIHVLLDKQESKNHLLVARTRYIKYCYYETYRHAVEALQNEKQHSYRELRKETALKRTTSYKQGLLENLPPKPHTESIDHTYNDLTPAQKKRRAPDMVKDEITHRISKLYGGCEEQIRRKIVRYIREGKGLHYILQGTVRLNPGLLILFPSWESYCPSLDLSKFEFGIDGKGQEHLSRPIELRDIDGLTLEEATWFGKLLQARPALREQLPHNVLNIILDSSEGVIDLRDRDPEEFQNEPLRFFT